MSTAMGEVLPYRAPHEPAHTTSYIGMLIFMGAWAMMFACLFFAYGALRLGTKEWPPLGQPAAPVPALALSTLFILASSASLELELRRLRLRRIERPGLWILFAALLGAAFLAAQGMIGRHLFLAGLTPWSGPYATVFYGLAGIHAAHALVGVGALAALTVMAVRGRYTTPQHLPLRLWSIYWHFVGAMWLLMFLVVFCF